MSTMARRSAIQIMLTDEEYAACRTAAGRETFSAWGRRMLLVAAGAVAEVEAVPAANPYMRDPGDPDRWIPNPAFQK